MPPLTNGINSNYKCLGKYKKNNSFHCEYNKTRYVIANALQPHTFIIIPGLILT